MQGNSLIPTFDGKYINLDTKSQQHINVNAMRKEKQHLYELKQKYYNAKGVEKHELNVKIKDTILKLISRQLGYESRAWYQKNAVQTTLDFDEVSSMSFDKVRQSLPAEKLESIELAEKLHAELNDNSVSVDERAKIDIRFFDWRMMFTEVFDNGGEGFDIVIGNPPYVRQEKIDINFKKLLCSQYPNVGNGTADLLVYFFGIAFKVWKHDSVVSFITSNKFLKTKYGKELRNTLASTTDVVQIIDFFELPVFHNASTDAGITLIINREPKDATKYFPVKSLDNLNLDELTAFLAYIYSETGKTLFPSKSFKLADGGKTNKKISGKPIDLVSKLNKYIENNNLKPKIEQKQKELSQIKYPTVQKIMQKPSVKTDYFNY